MYTSCILHRQTHTDMSIKVQLSASELKSWRDENSAGISLIFLDFLTFSWLYRFVKLLHSYSSAAVIRLERLWKKWDLGSGPGNLILLCGYC